MVWNDVVIGCARGGKQVAAADSGNQPTSARKTETQQIQGKPQPNQPRPDQLQGFTERCGLCIGKQQSGVAAAVSLQGFIPFLGLPRTSLLAGYTVHARLVDGKGEPVCSCGWVIPLRGALASNPFASSARERTKQSVEGIRK